MLYKQNFILQVPRHTWTRVSVIHHSTSHVSNTQRVVCTSVPTPPLCVVNFAPQAVRVQWIGQWSLRKRPMVAWAFLDLPITISLPNIAYIVKAVWILVNCQDRSASSLRVSCIHIWGFLDLYLHVSLIWKNPCFLIGLFESYSIVKSCK